MNATVSATVSAAAEQPPDVLPQSAAAVVVAWHRRERVHGLQHQRLDIVPIGDDDVVSSSNSSSSHSSSSSGITAMLAADARLCSDSDLAVTESTAAEEVGSGLGSTIVKDIDKVCRVCGDVSLGHNFGVMTCESCKAFFRRTASKEKALKCIFAGDCLISIKTRRFCSTCRLRKCFSMGMRKDMILDESERRRRKELLDYNKAKKLERLDQMRHQQQVASSQFPAASTTAADDAAATVVSATTCGYSQLDATVLLTTVMPGDTSDRGECRLDNDEPCMQATVQEHATATGLASTPSAANAAAVAEGPASAMWPVEPASAMSSLSSPLLRAPIVQDRAVSQTPGDHDYSSPGLTVTVWHSEDYITYSPPVIGTVSHSLLPPTSSGFSGVGDGVSNSVASSSVPAAGLVLSSRHPVTPLASPFSSWTRAAPAKRCLTSEQSSAIARVCTAYDAALGSLSVFQTGLVPDCLDLETAINSTALHVRCLVKFARAIPEFASAPETVQQSLLKSAVLPCTLLFFASIYETDTDSWLDCSGSRMSVTEAFGRMPFAGPQAAKRHSALIGSIKQLVPVEMSLGKSDVSVFALLHAVVLLSPEQAVAPAGGRHHDAAADVSDAQQRYVGLLCSYLQATISYSGAAELLPMLMQRLTAVKQHADGIVNLMATACNRLLVEPLLREVYELHLVSSAEPQAKEQPDN